MPKPYEILYREELAPKTILFNVYAPMSARSMQAGQFVILRVTENGERIPISISGWDREKGTIRIIIMAAGRTSTEATMLQTGNCFQDIVGPLGKRSHVEKLDGTVVVIGGGYGTGAVIPTAHDMKNLGNKVIGIIGARTESLLLLENDMSHVCDEVMVTTNDGSKGIKGFVTHALDVIMKREKVDYVLAVGPVPMMKAVTEMTRADKIQTWVSLNAIMVDGTGMCGACRCSVGGKTKFACIHGPDFNGHEVDFDELTARQKMFINEEKIAMEALTVEENA